MFPRLFRTGARYSRKDVIAELGISPSPTGGNWYTGYNSHNGAHFIFCNVGAQGRTGHDYANGWESPNVFRWYGKNGTTAGQKQIRAMTRKGAVVHLFHRSDNRDPFTYAGLVNAIRVQDAEPVKVLWEVLGEEIAVTEEISSPERFIEGATRRVSVNAYERDRNARQECLVHYGATCTVCQFDFEARYGELGRGYIHVHHLVPLASIGEEYLVDAINDLRPVCPNCHAMLHRTDPPLRPDELRNLLR